MLMCIYIQAVMNRILTYFFNLIANSVPVVGGVKAAFVLLLEASRISQGYSINTLRPRQNGCHFPDNIFKRIFLNENVQISINV